MAIRLGGIELYAGPPVLGGPDDLDAVIRDFIDGAKQSVLIAVQELDSRSIAQAVLAAAARPKVPVTATKTKVRVQVILEGSYLTEDKPLLDPFAPGGANETNRTLHAALLRAGVDVITDLNPEIFHQKFMVRDAGTETAAVLDRINELHPDRYRHKSGGQPRAVRQQSQPHSRAARKKDHRSVPDRVPPAYARGHSVIYMNGSSPNPASSGSAPSGSSRSSRRGTALRWRS